MAVTDTLKARTFLGCTTIRTGLFVIAFLQLLTGTALFLSYQYLRPSLHGVAWSQLVLFSVSAVLGIIGAWRRSTTVEGLYFATFLLNVVFLVLAILDFTDVLHMMPKAPEGATASFLQLKRGTHPQSFPVPLRGQSSTHVTVLNALRAEPVRAAQDVQKALETLPFVPHIGETEGESEEISVDELPPEAKTLTQESQATVIAITKMQKRPVKLAFAGVFGALLLAHLYFGWIILTFLLNKCMSLDELTGQPEQFQPLIHDG